MSGSKPKKQTVGFKYYLTMHLGLCHGTVDGIHSLWFGDKVAWQGNIYPANVNGTNQFRVNEPGLFGGDDTGGEGGVSGLVEVGFGSGTQKLLGVKDDGTWDLGAMRSAGITVSEIPTYACNYRGIAVLNLYDWYWGTNPYLKNVSVEASRYPSGWLPDNHALTKIGVDANPSCMIYECATDREWGMGYGAQWLDQNSFQNAAQTLHNEAFGLSMSMQSQQTVEDFVGSICEQIDAAFYFRPSIGKWVLNLIRQGDPVRHQFDQDNCKLKSFKRRLLGETINQVTLRYTDPITEDFTSVGVQDDANIEAQGQPVPGTKEYPGIRSEGLALRAAQRELRLGSACLATAEVEANRKAWDLIPGDTVTFSWPRLQVVGLRMRVTDVTHGESGSSKITVALVEDVFGQTDDPFAGLSGPRGSKDLDPPGPYDDVVFWELPFWFMRQTQGIEETVLPSILTTWATFLLSTNNNDFRRARLNHREVKPSGETYSEVNNGGLVSVGVLAFALERNLDTPMWLEPDPLLPEGAPDWGMTFPGQVEVDSFAVIGEGRNQEIIRVLGTNSDELYESVVTWPGYYPVIERGLMDTHIQRWPRGTKVRFINDPGVLEDPFARSALTDETYKIAMQGSRSTTPLDTVAATVVPMFGRQGRPYPAQNVQIRGKYFPWDTFKGYDFVITWNTRNRLLQDADAQILWRYPHNLVPEEGTIFRVTMEGQYYQGAPWVVLESYEGPWVESLTMSVPDLPGGVRPVPSSWPDRVRLTIRAERTTDGLVLENYEDFVHEWDLVYGSEDPDPPLPQPGEGEYIFVPEKTIGQDVRSQAGFMDDGQSFGYFRPGGGLGYGDTINVDGVVFKMPSEGQTELTITNPDTYTIDEYYWANPNGSYDPAERFETTARVDETWESNLFPAFGPQLFNGHLILGLVRPAGSASGVMIMEGDTTTDNIYWLYGFCGIDWGSSHDEALGDPPGRRYAEPLEPAQFQATLRGVYIPSKNVTAYVFSTYTEKPVPPVEYPMGKLFPLFKVMKENWTTYLPYHPTMACTLVNFHLTGFVRAHYLYKAPGAAEPDPTPIFPPYPWE